MGMSRDFEVAIMNGATRIGTSFFKWKNYVIKKINLTTFIDYFTEDGEEVEFARQKQLGAETQPVPRHSRLPKWLLHVHRLVKENQ